MVLPPVGDQHAGLGQARELLATAALDEGRREVWNATRTHTDTAGARWLQGRALGALEGA